MKEHEIRAVYTDTTITVYQAYNEAIANAAVKAQTFTAPTFKIERMTWIKPSFLWMMYRAGWAVKENQEHILAITIKREGFEWALQNSCLSHFDKNIHPSHEEWKEALQNTPVRIQWDPEKDMYLQPLPYRSLQIGLSGVAVKNYVNEWITGIEDITDYCRNIHSLIQNGDTQKAERLLPIEKVYTLPEDIRIKINGQ